ncbi:hypothetical protein [Gimesia sp.]|uniref:hypothetical protein n=1 Tax=Gimesia sp. TaxID=2024833 RepID=UPI000C51542F|nr:hypothetical protein [Gimesia sp.]MAX38069.1 hypothetical protein [Gimesia sp.]HAH46250.1 hypothetical protein [Planctomycetaceae bacterium]HBL44353.1 hypothetical protein [Planctomycetaceae bacterium]|tara:strand:- start:2254 stop:2853 length:600 start_codon:yes stop_codon:yes gene_type:complete
MLLKKSELEAIHSGQISVVYRRWKRPTVKTGGTLKTSIGLLSIDRVTQIDRSAVTVSLARQAGFSSRAELLELLDQREGDIYQINIHYAGADPRIALRESRKVSKTDLLELQKRLDRLDGASKEGPWTRRVLGVLKEHPHQAAVDLAALTGFEKDWLKTNIRKLKNLGLTISHQPGYELSPRGKVVYEKLQKLDQPFGA